MSDARFMMMPSQEEVERSQREVNKFLLNLDWNTKYNIRQLLHPVIIQVHCDHVWIDPNTYENTLDKRKEFCQKCRLTRPIKSATETPKTEETNGIREEN